MQMACFSGFAHGAIRAKLPTDVFALHKDICIGLPEMLTGMFAPRALLNTGGIL